MEERILGLAAEITGEEPTELLKTLCLSAEAAWRSRLRPEAVEWEDALCCAAAFTAAADYRLSRRGDGIDAFTAGAVSIKAGAVADSAALSTALRLAAEQIMAPYGESGEVCLRGIPG